MKRIDIPVYFIGLMFVLTALPIAQTHAQESVVGALRFTVPDLPGFQILEYGFGSNYTDSTDRGLEQMIPPFPPPGSSYLVYLDRDCDFADGDPPCWWKADFRGLPDSVESGSAKQFALEYSLGVRNNTGRNVSITILNSDWPSIIDSINIVDAQVARALNHTFTGPEVVEIEDPLTSRITMTVYYNLQPSSIVASEEVIEDLKTTPNPVTGTSVFLRGEFSVGERVIVTNMLGEQLLEQRIGNNRSTLKFSTSDFPSGMYGVVVLDENGVIIRRTTFIVNR